MKIETGKYYRARGGQVFGPMVLAEEPTTKYIWRLSHALDQASWDEEGVWRRGWSGPFDLISEVHVSDTPSEAAPAPEAKTLRDEFAMEAMKLLLPKHDWVEGILALYSYKHADAMMEARKK